MKSILSKLFFSLIFLLLTQYSLADEYVTCNNCNDFTITAKNSAPNINGRYNIHIADFNNEVLKSFRVRVIYIGSEPGLPKYSKFVRLIESSATLKNEFTQFIQKKHQMITNAQEVVNTSAGSNTGWDLYGDTARQDAFLQNFYNHPSLAQWIGNGFNGLASVFDITVDFEVHLDNGAIIALTYDRSELTSDGLWLALYKINFKDSRDKFGNPLTIPEGTSANGSSIERNFVTGTQTHEDYLAAAQRSGYYIIYSGAGSSNGTGGLVVRCTATKGKITCIYTRPT